MKNIGLHIDNISQIKSLNNKYNKKYNNIYIQLLFNTNVVNNIDYLKSLLIITMLFILHILLI